MLQQWIDVQFAKLQEQAEQMKTTAERIRVLADEELLLNMNDTKRVWMGEAADAFLGKEVRLCTELTVKADELEKAARLLEGYAKAMYCAEKCNESIGNLRTY